MFTANAVFIIGGSFFLIGCFFGWIVGQRAGFDDGVEHERQQKIKKPKGEI